MLLPHMTKQGKDCHTFISKEMVSKMEYNFVFLIYNYRQFTIKSQNLWVRNFKCFCCHLYSPITFLKFWVQTLYIALSHTSIVKESDWGLVRHFILWPVFPFMAGLSFQGPLSEVYCNGQHLLLVFRHYFFCFATVKLLKSLSLFTIFLWNYYTLSQYLIEVYPI